MSDLLEPMRRAAELGCKRFRNKLSDGDPVNSPPEYQIQSGAFKSLDSLVRKAAGLPDANGIKPELPEMNGAKRMLEDASAVCAEWWRDRQIVVPDNPNEEFAVDLTVHSMIDLCREFGRKFGGNA